MVLVRKPETELLQGAFATFPDISEWRTRDLYSKHPTKPYHWLYEGRADDIIVFSNGEKLNPLTPEQSIEAHPEIRSAVVIGAGRFQAGLLLDVQDQSLDTDHQSQVIERVWPLVQEANNNTVAHGRISKNLIFFTKPEQPLLRTAKGSVRKKLSIELYTKEIDMLFQEADLGAEVPSQSSLNLSKPESVLLSLRDAVEGQTGWKPQADDEELFSSGLDSLQKLNLTRQINSAPGMAALIEPKDVYSHPTTETLAALIYEKRDMASHSRSTKSRSEQMEHVFQEYLADLPITARAPSPPKDITIILTGSTGSLGSYLLDCLMSNDKVRHVYCLNRSSDSAQRQESIQKERGLPTQFGEKVEILQCNFAKPYFGLSQINYRKLLKDATHILHNAWLVNFNQTLDSFSGTHVHGVRQLINFSSRSTYSAAIYFLSTIGTVRKWNVEDPERKLSKIEPFVQKVPEQIFETWSVSQAIGYAESKHISERLLDSAANLCDQRTTVCRLGQIAGPVLRGEKGTWGRQEWFPSIIASSAHLGL